MKLFKLSKILSLTTAFAISSQVALLIQQNKALAGTGTSILYSGEYLLANQYLISPNGEYKVIQQSDGNFVLYDYSTFLWKSNTYNKPASYTTIQTDCNLVNYTYNGTPVWASRTDRRGSNCRLQLQNDGNLVIYTGNNVPVWQTRTYKK
ncbi:MAG: hypothetical protein V7L25_12205 [Nostoc sp.]|uniref:hypothetical protein n=1 Tax=Nostoc sp. TaxID=1180 RepID=UPI002FEFFE3E